MIFTETFKFNDGENQTQCFGKSIAKISSFFFAGVGGGVNKTPKVLMYFGSWPYFTRKTYLMGFQNTVGQKGGGVITAVSRESHIHV